MPVPKGTVAGEAVVLVKEGIAPMRTVGIVLGILMIFGGGVWILQGINLLPGSFMTGDPRWALRGLVLALLGVVLLVIAIRRRSKPGGAG
jgi:uncharacterized membrane protein HdeD (DUF308 family)